MPADRHRPLGADETAAMIAQGATAATDQAIELWLTWVACAVYVAWG